MMKPTRSWTTGLGLKTLAIVLLSTLLISCGSSKKYDEFVPTRIISAGDAMSYLEASPSFNGVALPAYANRLSVLEDNANVSGTYDHWLKQFASGYWAPTLGNSASTSAKLIMLRTPTLSTPAPVVSRHGDATPPSDATLTDIKAQLAGFTPQANDLLVLTVGMGDILELAERYLAGATSVDTLLNLALARGQAYMAYADSLYQSGVYQRIILINPIDISNSPYAQNAKAGSTLNPSVDTVISQITNKFTFGLKTNPPTYPRNGGVWLFDATNLLLNINQATNYSVNLTVPVCDEKASPRAQHCSAREVDIAADLALGGLRTSNPNSMLNNDAANAVLALSTKTSDITTTALATTKYSSANYFYAGSFMPTPFVHRYMGAVLYSRMRSAMGF